MFSHNSVPFWRRHVIIGRWVGPKKGQSGKNSVLMLFFAATQTRDNSFVIFIAVQMAFPLSSASEGWLTAAARKTGTTFNPLILKKLFSSQNFFFVAYIHKIWLSYIKYYDLE